MSRPVDHEGLDKVLLAATDETVWAEPAGRDRWRLDNVPFFEPAYQLDDVVVGRRRPDGQIEATEIAEHGGHATARLLFTPLLVEEERATLLASLTPHGTWLEVVGGGFVVIDLSPEADRDAIAAVLDGAARSGAARYEIGGSPGFLAECQAAVETDGWVLRHPGPLTLGAESKVLVEIDDNPLSSHRWEELWARPADGGRLELDSVPFQAYRLAPGDVVEVLHTAGRLPVLATVGSHGGHYSLRATGTRRVTA